MHKFIIIIFSAISLIGCNSKENELNENNKLQAKQVGYSNVADASEVTKKINALVLKNKGVYDAISVKSNNRILVALKIKQMAKLQKKKIEKEINQNLTTTFAPYAIHVTTDKKIFWEIEKLNKKKDKTNLDEDFNHLIKLSKDKT
ncbi:hypothetical protein CIB95_07730 [Lottiidibacillus patelloidae]|uniref:Sporulation protein n=1 Tax=Lottiidibacillus patelloidae TaxID=2670334 RepID=A0A263BUX6_9BACI|nr:YhcN/YlaJ family sporulation lipoprotein [Lottiidibacillus patelloidae]OZM57342.1 hypothetical protein CIB95_07730 [Lottiidibacillus patelloidae]